MKYLLRFLGHIHSKTKVVYSMVIRVVTRFSKLKIYEYLKGQKLARRPYYLLRLTQLFPFYV